MTRPPHQCKIFKVKKEETMPTVKTISLTKDGKAKLEAELADLKSQRPAIAERIATARTFGDLSENAEYSAARDEQKTIENRILEIEDILKNAKIIRAKSGGKVNIGSTVKVKTGDKELEYTVVGPVEANPLEGKVSYESPLGKALMGKSEGETAELTTPKGKTEYQIVAVA